MRYDTGEFDSPIRTPNGYLRCDARITRTGVFEYRLHDGSTRRELRLPEDVFKADALSSFEDVPLTNEHPRERLDAKNTRRYQAGNVKNVRQNDHHVAARVLITDDDAIRDAEAGKTQLSCGYNCDLEERSGVTQGIAGVEDGLRYDAIQRNIVGNHVAIVAKARAGTSASLHLDDGDAVMVAIAEPTTPPGPTPGPAGGNPMKVKVRIDDVDFEMDESGAQAVGKLLGRLDGLGKNLASAQKTCAELQARADKADEDLAEERKQREDSASPEKVRDLVKGRVALETTAAKVLADDTIKLDEMSDGDIKKAVVLKVSPGAKERLDNGGKEVEGAYLEARFDAAVDTWNAEQAAKPKPSHIVRGAAGGGERLDARSARKRMVDDNHKMGIDPIRPSNPNS